MPKRLTSAQKVSRMASKATKKWLKSQGGLKKQAKNGRWVSALKKRK